MLIVISVDEDDNVEKYYQTSQFIQAQCQCQRQCEIAKKEEQNKLEIQT